MLSTSRLEKLADTLVFPVRALDGKALRTDLHLHTDFTDGRSSIQEMLDAASEKGLTAVAFTEHVRRGITWFGEFREEVLRGNRTHPHLNVLIGIEAKALDRKGSLDADEALCDAVDLVLGAFHGYPDGQGNFLSASLLDPEQAAKLEFETCWGLLENPSLDVLAHPGALTRKHFGFFPEAYLRMLVRKAASEGRAIEINGEYNSREQLAQLLHYCRQENAWITLGSNAHGFDEVGKIARIMEGETYGYQSARDRRQLDRGTFGDQGS